MNLVKSFVKNVAFNTGKLDSLLSFYDREAATGERKALAFKRFGQFSSMRHNPFIEA